MPCSSLYLYKVASIVTLPHGFDHNALKESYDVFADVRRDVRRDGGR